jgi:cytochrome P450
MVSVNGLCGEAETFLTCIRQHQLNTGGAGPVSVTAFSTIRHDVHRIRRDPMAKFFSRTKMLSLENEVHHFAQKTKDKMLTFAGKGVFDVKEAFNCFTADVISYYAFGESMGFLAQDGWEPNFASWVKSFFKSAYIMRHNTLARKVAHIMPFMANYLGKDIQAVMRIMHVTIPGYIDNALENPHNGRVFAEMMSKPEAMSVEEKYRFSGEGFNLLLAGTETTAVCHLSNQQNAIADD